MSNISHILSWPWISNTFIFWFFLSIIIFIICGRNILTSIHTRFNFVSWRYFWINSITCIFSCIYWVYFSFLGFIIYFSIWIFIFICKIIINFNIIYNIIRSFIYIGISIYDIILCLFYIIILIFFFFIFGFWIYFIFILIYYWRLLDFILINFNFWFFNGRCTNIT